MAERTHRRLAGILAADVVGYSRLMGEDETGTLERLKSYRKDVVQPTITEHRGRIVKLMGDGVLAEFPSVIEAVQCAVDIQHAMNGCEGDVPEERRIRLRIGVNLGDIIVEGSDIYGDGVNIAARLESLAEPDGICISAIAFDAVDGKLELEFDDIGPQQLKNIGKPVRVYRLAAVGGRDEPPTLQTGSLALPDKPSIAVLPFTNMSGDPEQEFFSDGISEDIITELSRFRSLFVVARNSSFQFRGDAIDVRAVGTQLGVYYVLEGSVRKSGQRIRVTAQLIDATTNEHVWAERYDGTTEDIFDLQDNISRSIVSTIAGRLDDTHAERLSSRAPKDYNAYEQVLRGQKWMQKYSLDDYAEARKCLEAAIALDPGFARAHACLGLVAFYEWNGSTEPVLLDEAFRASETALELDPHESRCHLALGVAHMFRGDHEKADYHLKRASELNPNDDLILIENGRHLMYMGRPADGAELVRLAMRRNPFFPNWYWNILGRCLHTAQIYHEAIAAFERISTPQWFNYVYLAACHAGLGHPEAVRSNVDKAMQLKSDFTISDFAGQLPYRSNDDLETFLDGLRAAGFPE